MSPVLVGMKSAKISGYEVQVGGYESHYSVISATLVGLRV